MRDKKKKKKASDIERNQPCLILLSGLLMFPPTHLFIATESLSAPSVTHPREIQSKQAGWTRQGDAGRSRVKSSRNSSDREVASLKTQKQLGGKNKEEKKLSTLLIRNECACLVELKKKPQSS